MMYVFCIVYTVYTTPTNSALLVAGYILLKIKEDDHTVVITAVKIPALQVLTSKRSDNWKKGLKRA